MLGFLSNRVTAAHLALAAVAPLVLSKYFSVGAVNAVTPWIVVICVMWAVMAPVRRGEERSPVSRSRFLRDAASDPFLWVSVVVLLYSAVVALNSGVGLSYDPETRLWRLAPPSFEMLPGTVPGFGGMVFTSSLLVFAVYSAVAHSLDSRQSVYFAVAASLVVVADAAFAYASWKGVAAESSVAYGLWGLAAAAAMLSSEISRRRTREMLALLALAGCLSAMMLSGKVAEMYVFSAAVVLLVVLFVGFRFRRLGRMGVIRAFLMLSVSAGVAAALFHCLSGDWQSLMPVWRTESDAILNRLAVTAWKTSPWTGSGVGSFPFVAKIGATAEDWTTLGAMPDFYSNGWRVLLAERGMIGVLAFATALGAMFFTWFRYAWQRGLENFTAAVPLLPLASVAVSVVMVFDSSAMRPEAIVAFAGIAALSVNGGQ